MKKTKISLFIGVIFLLSVSVSFAQNNSLDGVWYYIDGDEINMRVFRENQTADFRFSLSATTRGTAANQSIFSGAYTVRPVSLALKNYTIESLGRMNIDGRVYRYNASPLMLILWERTTPNYYHPVLEMNSDALIGNWIVPGEEYDIEVEITANRLTIKRGRIQRVFSYSSGGFPVINLKDSNGTDFFRNYFFFGRDIVALNIPGEAGTYIFQRQN